MIIDARYTPPDNDTHWDVCIIGAGAAGISVALEFLSESRINVLVLEAGGLNYDAATQALYRGTLDSDCHAPLVRSRYSALGGTTRVWAGWCRPLDAEDFMPHPLRPDSVWPIDAAELAPYYRRAMATCGLGTAGYTLAEWQDSFTGRPLIEDDDIEHVVFQIRGLDFARYYYDRLAQTAHITLALHAPVLRLTQRPGRLARVDVTVALKNDKPVTLRPHRIVLAAGGLENPRLLLLSGNTPEQAIGNCHGNVGRYFTEHGFADPGWFVPSRPEQDLRFYFDRPVQGPGGHYRVRPVLTLAAAARQRLGLMNAMLSFYPAYEAHAIFTSPAVKAALEFWLIRKGRAVPDGRYGLLLQALSAPHQLARALWRKTVVKPPVRRWRLRVYYECRPVADNRITLGPARDRFGRPQLHLRWHLQDADLDSVHRFCQHIDQRLRMHALGSLSLPPTPADWRGLTECGKHPMGATRMAHDAGRGVVDPNARVFGTQNLYIAGSSVFPSVGYANPTLTIVALAIRLADHLKAQSR